MEIKGDLTLVGMVRAAPLRSAMFTFGPILLALAQLLNSFLHGLPWRASVPFALVMLAYSVFHVRYHRAQLHLRELEAGPSTAAD